VVYPEVLRSNRLLYAGVRTLSRRTVVLDAMPSLL
jgi:hypothetical protein